MNDQGKSDEEVANSEINLNLPLSNYDRLASHLATDGLASTLLAAWRSKGDRNSQEVLKKALQAFYAPKDQT